MTTPSYDAMLASAQAVLTASSNLKAWLDANTAAQVAVYANAASTSELNSNQSATSAANSAAIVMNNRLALMRAAAVSAPLNLAAIQRFSGLTITRLAASAAPAAGTFDRHYISGNGIGFADLQTKAHLYNFPNWDYVFGQGSNVIAQQSDGSAADQYYPYKKDPNDVYVTSQPYVTIRSNTRRVWIPSRNYTKGTIRVDGKYPPIGTTIYYDAGDGLTQNCLIDLQTSSGAIDRTITFIGANVDAWVSEILVDAGATFSFIDPTIGKAKISFLGDDWGMDYDYSQSGLPYLDAMMALMGGAVGTRSCIAGTGYAQNVAGDIRSPAAYDPVRLATIAQDNPDVLVLDLGRRDGWPNSSTGVPTATGIHNTISGARALLPAGLFYVIPPIPPQQSLGAAGGKYQSIMAALAAELALDPGMWILADPINGGWSTSWGTASTVASGAWITGDGNTSNNAGTGNAKTYMTASGTPSAAGFQYVAQTAANTYLTALQSQ